MKLYIGCMVSSRLPFIEAATRFVFERLDIDAPNLKGAPCCMEPVGLRSVSYDVWKGNTELIAEMADKDRIVTICDGCSISLSNNGIDTTNLLEILNDNIDGLKEKIVSPIRIKLAVFPGCHCEAVCKKRNIDAYKIMSDVVGAIGSEPLIPERNLCCGGGVSGIDDGLSKKIMTESVDSFKATGADAAVVSCPFCFMQFDTFARYRTYHIAELLAHAMGWNVDTEKYHRGK